MIGQRFVSRDLGHKSSWEGAWGVGGWLPQETRGWNECRMIRVLCTLGIRAAQALEADLLHAPE